MSGDIKIAGLASGIPFDELVSQMLEAEKYQAKKLESWRKTWENKIDTLRDLSSRVSSLQTVNNSLRIASSFISRVATSTNNNVAGITVDSNARAGLYEVEVASEVRHKIGSAVFEIGKPMNPGGGIQSLEMQIGKDTLKIDIPSGYSLEDIMDSYQHNHPAFDELRQHVDLSIEAVGNGFQRLVMTSKTSGSAGKINILSDDSPLKFNQSTFDQHFRIKDDPDNEIYAPLSVVGQYTGHTNKQIIFTVERGGTASNGDDSIIEIRWTDPSDGKNGLLRLPINETDENDDIVEQEIYLFQGLSVKLNPSELRSDVQQGQQFTLDLYASDIQLAQDKGLAQSAQLISSTSYKSPSAVIVPPSGGAKNFEYSYRGESINIAIPEGTTLEGLVRLINDNPSNPGVHASILNNGSGDFFLVLTGEDSGAANQIVVSENNDILAQNEFIVSRQATNALIKLNGLPHGADEWLSRGSNLVTDLITGASVRLNDTGVTHFNITTDIDDMADKVQAFVDEYNALLEYIDEITKVVLDENEEANINAGGVLVGNYAVNMLRSALRAFVGSRASGFDVNSDMFSLLTQVGMKSNHQSRRLEFDRNEFIDTINKNERDIVRLFSADSEATLDTRGFNIEPGIAGLDKYSSGNYDFKVEYEADGTLKHVEMYDSTTNQVYTSNTDIEPSEIRISEDGKSFSIHVGGARNMIINNVQNASSDMVNSFTLTVKDGKAKSFDEEINKLFDETSGITKVLERNYENIIRNIDKRIEREYMRVLQVKKRLEIRFARLEVNMGNWNGQMERLQQQIRQLPAG